jgi:DNA-binding MarR family transcriptional regulator
MTAAAPDFYRPDGFRAEDSVGYLMKRIGLSIVQQVDRRLEAHGLTSAQWGPLFKIHQGEATTVAALAQALQTDVGAMTRLLDRLEAKGLCRRMRSESDRRVVRIEPTPAGEAVASEVRGVLAEVMNAHLAGFSKAEWHTLQALLRRMLANGDAMRLQEPAP